MQYLLDVASETVSYLFSTEHGFGIRIQPTFALVGVVRVD